MAVTQDKAAATLAPLIFALVFPLFETVGGYFYDLSELLFLSAAALFAVRGWWLALIILTPFAEFNKESFLFFLVTLYPLVRQTRSVRFTAGLLLSAVLTAGILYIKVKSCFVGNPGETAQWHLYEQLAFLINPASYLETEYNYGMLTGRGFFIFHVLCILLIVKRSWQRLAPPWQAHTKLALTINLPLFMALCAPGELRNLSLMYPALVVLLAAYLSEVMEKNRCKTDAEKKTGDA